MVHCARCGSKVPKKRITKETGSQYAGFFCSTACHVAYADEMIGMFRSAEQEAEQELQTEVAEGQAWTKVLDDIDEAAAEATLEGQQPREIAARFLGKVAGKVATQLYSRIESGMRSWATSRQAAQAEQGQAETEERRPAANGKKAERNGKHERNVKANKNGAAGPPKAKPQSEKTERPEKPTGKPEPKRPDPNNPTGEPLDLDDYSLEEQRDWLLKRYTLLKPNPTWDDVTKEWRRLTMKYHPDKPTGNGKLAALVNSTYQRLKAIKDEIGWPGSP